MSSVLVQPSTYPSWRPLRPEEEKVQFATIEQKLDQTTDRFVSDLAKYLQSARDDVIVRAKRLRKRGWSQLREMSVRANFVGYRSYLKTHMNDLYQTSKTLAAKEMGVSGPVTSEAFSQWLDSKAQIVSRLHVSLLDAKIQTALLARTKGQTVEEVIGGVFDDFATKELAKGGGLLGVLSLQGGRRDVIQRYQEEIQTLTWSAILDQRVCAVCAFLDGLTWYADDASVVWPPIHWECRCILVPTMKGSPYTPTVTGLSDSWYDLPEEYKEFGRIVGAYQGEE